MVTNLKCVDYGVNKTSLMMVTKLDIFRNRHTDNVMCCKIDHQRVCVRFLLKLFIKLSSVLDKTRQNP